MVTNEHQEVPENGEPVYEKTALARHYQQQGHALENLRHMLTWLPNKQVYVYNVFVRFPRSDTEEHLCIVKGVAESGPQITFHGGWGLIGTLLSLGTRYRQGKLNWREDDSPPESYGVYAEYIAKEVAYFVEHGIGTRG